MKDDLLLPGSSMTLDDSPASIDFHIRSDDYFSFLATLIGFVEECLNQCEAHCISEENKLLARTLRNDLRFVQANYRIIPRPESELQRILGSGNQIVQSVG